MFNLNLTIEQLAELIRLCPNSIINVTVIDGASKESSTLDMHISVDEEKEKLVIESIEEPEVEVERARSLSLKGEFPLEVNHE